jgi:hypothetical protein
LLYADRLCKVGLCATKELALCLDLILGRRIWCSMQISCPMWSGIYGFVHRSDLMQYDCRLINKKKNLVDVAPHSSEPRISCVLLCFVRCGLCLALLLLCIMSASNVVS